MRRLMYMANGRVKQGKLGELEDWLLNNAKRLQDHAPPGWTWKGDYTYELGLGGPFNVIGFWECSDKWADVDVWMAHEDETWERLKREFATFFDPEAEAFMLKELVDWDEMESAERTA